MLKRLLVIGPYVLIVLLGFFGLREQENRVSAVQQDRLEARFRDCRAYDDVGNAIKQGIGVLTNQTQPSATAAEKARIQAFIQEYSSAVDGAITTAKVNKGYAPDCSSVGGTK